VVVDGQEVDGLDKADMQVDCPAATALTLAALTVRPADLAEPSGARERVFGIRVGSQVRHEILKFIVGHELGAQLGKGPSFNKEHG